VVASQLHPIRKNLGMGMEDNTMDTTERLSDHSRRATNLLDLRVKSSDSRNSSWEWLLHRDNLNHGNLLEVCFSLHHLGIDHQAITVGSALCTAQWSLATTLSTRIRTSNNKGGRVQVRQGAE
jgi:hypothetical protein